MRAVGAPPAPAVASVIALGRGNFARSASSNQRSNWRSGSESACASARPARMYSWRSAAMFMRGFYVAKNHFRGKTAFFPRKVVDTPLWIRHLHVTAAAQAENPDRTTYTVQRRNRDGEEEGEEGWQEA